MTAAGAVAAVGCHVPSPSPWIGPLIQKQKGLVRVKMALINYGGWPGL